MRRLLPGHARRQATAGPVANGTQRQTPVELLLHARRQISWRPTPPFKRPTLGSRSVHGKSLAAEALRRVEQHAETPQLQTVEEIVETPAIRVFVGSATHGSYESECCMASRMLCLARQFFDGREGEEFMSGKARESEGVRES